MSRISTGRDARSDRPTSSTRAKRSQNAWHRGIATSLALGALTLPVPATAANDPKDMKSQNADDADVLQSTGQLSLRIEIEVPKGTGGSEPKLALRYSSTLADGAFGVGWQLELGEIRRSARFGTPRYDDAAGSPDRFEFDGVLLVEHPDQVNHPGEYRTLQESFARITRTPGGSDDHWLVEFPNGRKARFGTSQQARIRKGGSTDPEGDSGPIGRWLLSELEDAHGNITRFEYDRSTDIGTAYPKAIRYSFRGTPGTLVGGTERRIEFDLEARDDPIYGFPAGLETRISKRVKEIRSVIAPAGGSPEVYRRLALGYAGVSQYTSTGRTRLASAQLFGTDCPLGQDTTTCQGLPAKTFTYTDTAPAILDEPEAQWDVYNWGGPALHFALAFGGDRGVRIGDVNGDGHPDFVQAWRRSGEPNQFEVYLSDGTGWGSRSAEWEAALKSLAVHAYQINEVRVITAGKQFTCDIADPPISVEENVFFHYEDPYQTDPPRILPKVEARLMDLNADGFADILLSYETGAGAVSGATTCPGAPYGWAGHQVAYVWINRGKAEPDGPDDPDFGWEQRDDWSHDAQGLPSLPPLYSIYLWSDAGSNSSDRPGYVFPPGDNRLRLVEDEDKRGTAAYHFDHGVRMPDLNGDGRPDIVARRSPATFGLPDPVVAFPEGVWLSRADGVGWDHHPGSTSPYLPPEPIVVEFGYRSDNPKFVVDADTGVRFADVNGDGLADIVKTGAQVASPDWHSNFQHQPLPPAMQSEGVWLNTGDGWCDPSNCPAAQAYLPTGEDPGAGDPGPFAAIYRARAYVTKNGSTSGIGDNPKDFPGVRGTQLRFVDLNGDGLIDLLKTDDPAPVFGEFGGLNAWIHDPSHAAIWRQDQRFVPSNAMATIEQRKETGEAHGYEIWDAGVRIFDFDGDATVDLLKARKESLKKMFVSRTAYIDLLEEFDNGRGGVQRFVYGSAIAQRDAALEGAAADDAADLGEAGSIGIPRWTARGVVEELITEDTLAGGSTHVTTLRYAMPQWDPAHRTMLGFRAVEVGNDDGSKNRTFFWQQLGRAGRASRIVNLDSAGAVVRQKTSAWEVITGIPAEGEASIAGAYVGRVTQEVEANYYGSAGSEVAGATRATSYSYADSSGNSYGYNFVHRVEASRPTGTLITERIPEPAIIGPGAWAAGLIDREIASDGHGDVLAETEVDYSGTLPILVRKTVKKRHGASTAQFADWIYAYDPYGNLAMAIDPEGRTSYRCYDGDTVFLGSGVACPDALATGSHTHLVGVLDPLGEVTRIGRDLGSGRATEVERLYSGDLESIDLDPFGRPQRLWSRPSGHAEAKLLVERAYADDPAIAGRPYLEQWDYFKESSGTDPTAAVRSAVYADGFGRETIAVAPPAPGQAYPHGRAITQRDYAGRPLAGTHDLACTDPDCAALSLYAGAAKNAVTYDALGRALSESTPDGTTYLDYRPASLSPPYPPGYDGTEALDAVLVEDRSGNLVEYLLDGDRLVVVRECENTISPPGPLSSSVLCANPDTAFYSYEASGEHDAIYDAIATSTGDYTTPARFLRYHFDTLGRVYQIEDPDAGISNSQYDLVGNVTQTSDANGRSIQYSYDALNRIETIDTPGDAGDWDLLEIEYDPVTRKRSRVAEVTGMMYGESWSYDDFGNLATHVRSVSGRTLRTDFEHDLLGRLTKLQSPLQRDQGVSYAYEGAYLTSVCSRLDLEASCEERPSLYFVDGVAYDALGRIANIPYRIGNLTHQYFDVSDSSDWATGRAVNRLKAVALDGDPNGTRLSLSYKYDANGNVRRVEDGHDTDDMMSTADYFYDRRNRLSYWIDSSGVQKHFAYDALGNLVGRNLPAPPVDPSEWNQVYDHSNKPHAVRMSWKDKGYDYDAAGNATSRGGAEFITYNSLGQVHCVGQSAGACSVYFWYDIDGKLMAKIAGAGSEIYLGDYFRFDKSAGVAWTYTSAFGKRIVVTKHTGAALRTAWVPPPWRFPVDPALFLALLATTGLLGLLALLARLGAFEAVARRPVTTSIAVGVSLLVAAPPPVWARRGGGGVHTRFLFHDHLGTEILAIDRLGGVVERRIFEPFGEVIASQDDPIAGAPDAFTGKQFHDDLGWYNFGARWYDPEAGRFASVDPILQTPADPQTHNPYGYVRNNPIGFVDPDGRAIEGVLAISISELIYYVLRTALDAYLTYQQYRDRIESSSQDTGRIGPKGAGDAAVTQNTLPVRGGSAAKPPRSTANDFGKELSQSGPNPDPIGPNPGNFVKIEIFGFDVVPLGGLEFSSGLFFGRNRQGEFQFGPFVEAGPAIGAGLSVDTFGVEFVSNIDQLDRSLSINAVLGVGILNTQGNINPTPANNGERFIGDFVNGAGLVLSFGPIPVEGFYSFTQTRTFDVIGFGRRVFGQ